MSQRNPSSRRQIDQSGWVNGIDSYSSPLLVRSGYLRWAVNAVNKGGVWQTRPGFDTSLVFNINDPTSAAFAWWIAASQPQIIVQGMTWFAPSYSQPYLVFAISGSIWTTKIDASGALLPAVQLAGIGLGKNAAQVVFCRAMQSQSIVDGVVTPVAVRNVLLMQDGSSRACYWDGTTAGVLNPQKKVVVDPLGNTTYPAGFNETRIGLWMAWSGNRLFVSYGTQVFASDIGDPLHFTEELTLTSVPVINLPEQVNGLSDRGTSGNTNSQCLIFCANSTYAVYSGIEVRIPDATNGYPGWVGTPNFLSKIFAGTGCIAGKSVVNHRGLIYWLSPQGIVTFNSINTVTSSQNMPIINAEEAYGNLLLSPNQTLAAAGFYNSYVFWSMTAGATVGGMPTNAQTQVLDRQPMPQVPEELNAWQGIWTGIAPVEWATTEAYGQTRCYAISFDADGVPRIYQAFQANRADNGNPIPWSIETPEHIVDGGGIFDRSNFLYSRAFLQNVYGTVNMEWFWRSTRGTWHEILTTTITATPGPFLSTIPGYLPTDNVEKAMAFLPQVRDILSRNVRGEQPGCSSSLVEAVGMAEDDSDRAFAMLFQFSGRAALAAYRIATDNYTQNTEGEVIPAEEGYHILPGAGCPALIPVPPASP
jgi:hypothetical protein